MKMILRGDLRCPQRNCNAAIVEYRDGDRAEYRCKVHGPVKPTVRGMVELKYPVADTCRKDATPPDEAPAPYRITEERPR